MNHQTRRHGLNALAAAIIAMLAGRNGHPLEEGVTLRPTAAAPTRSGVSGGLERVKTAAGRIVENELTEKSLEPGAVANASEHLRKALYDMNALGLRLEEFTRLGRFHWLNPSTMALRMAGLPAVAPTEFKRHMEGATGALGSIQREVHFAMDDALLMHDLWRVAAGQAQTISMPRLSEPEYLIPFTRSRFTSEEERMWYLRRQTRLLSAELRHIAQDNLRDLQPSGDEGVRPAVVKDVASQLTMATLRATATAAYISDLASQPLLTARIPRAQRLVT